MKYFIIAGEASGDLHASNLVKELKGVDASVDLKGFGGDLMRDQGVELITHYKELAVMGVVDVLKKVWSIRRIFKKCLAEIEHFKPDGIILIDFSGFNLRIAKWAHDKGYKIHYYIAPQIWASRGKRIKKMKRYVDHLYVTLPFEPDFYKKHQTEVHFVGHPLIDALNNQSTTEKSTFLAQYHIASNKPLIALLPGSRKSEISHMLPTLLEMPSKFTECEFAIAMAPSIDRDFYEKHLGDSKVKLIPNDTYSLLKSADFALVTSGTATLETALLKVPQIVCYKTQPLTYWIAKKLIQLPYISLVNIILDKEAVPELIQRDLNAATLEKALKHLMKETVFHRQLDAYDQLEEMLGKEGASRRAALAIAENS